MNFQSLLNRNRVGALPIASTAAVLALFVSSCNYSASLLKPGGGGGGDNPGLQGEQFDAISNNAGCSGAELRIDLLGFPQAGMAALTVTPVATGVTGATYAKFMRPVNLQRIGQSVVFWSATSTTTTPTISTVGSSKYLVLNGVFTLGSKDDDNPDRRAEENNAVYLNFAGINALNPANTANTHWTLADLSAPSSEGVYPQILGFSFTDYSVQPAKVVKACIHNDAGTAPIPDTYVREIIFPLLANASGPLEAGDVAGDKKMPCVKIPAFTATSHCTIPIYDSIPGGRIVVPGTPTANVITMD